MNYTKTQIDKMRELLATRDAEVSDEETLFNVFIDGCRGWTNIEEEEVVEYFERHFNKDNL